MNSLIETTLTLLIMANLVILGSTKVKRAINIFALESPLIGLLVLLYHHDNLRAKIIFLIVITIVVKSILIPWLLFRSAEGTSMDMAVEPFVGYNGSVLSGLLALLVSIWLGTNLPLPSAENSGLTIPVAFYMTFVGLFLMITRKKAINQVIGYLILENGIYIFGTLFATHVPLLVELGILLDLIGGVFIMGITLFHINQSFDHIDISRLSDLKDWDI